MQFAEGLWWRACLLLRVQSGSGEERDCYSVRRGALVESVLAIQCIEGPGGQRACYSVCRGALVESVLAIQCVVGPVDSVMANQCAEGLW